MAEFCDWIPPTFRGMSEVHFVQHLIIPCELLTQKSVDKGKWSWVVSDRHLVRGRRRFTLLRFHTVPYIAIDSATECGRLFWFEWL